MRGKGLARLAVWGFDMLRPRNYRQMRSLGWAGLGWAGLGWANRSEPSRTVPNRPEPFRTVPNRSEPFRTVPNRPEPFRTVPTRSEPFRTVPNRPEPFRTIPNRSEPSPNRSEPFRTIPNRSEPSRTVPNRSEPFRTVPNRSEPFRTVPNRPEPSRPVPNRPEPFRTVPNRPEPSRTVPNRSGLAIEERLNTPGHTTALGLTKEKKLRVHSLGFFVRPHLALPVNPISLCMIHATSLFHMTWMCCQSGNYPNRAQNGSPKPSRRVAARRRQRSTPHRLRAASAVPGFLTAFLRPPCQGCLKFLFHSMRFCKEFYQRIQYPIIKAYTLKHSMENGMRYLRHIPLRSACADASLQPRTDRVML